MLKTRVDAMHAVAHPLIRAEQLIDQAIVELAAANSAAIMGRASSKLPLDAGQGGIDLVMNALGRIHAARKDVHAAHLDWRELQDRAGLGAYMASDDPGYGDTGDTPRTFMTAGPELTIAKAA